MKRSVPVLLALFLASACGVGDENGGGTGDDGEGDGDGDGTERECAAAASMGSLADATGTGERRNQMGSMGARQWYRGSVKIVDEAAPDFLVLELYDDYGAFAGGDVAPGTFEIGEQDASIDSCGLCAYVYVDVDEGTGAAQELYLAQSGTVTIEQVEPEIVGTISGATFAEVDPAEEALVADGCETALDDVAYTVALTCYGSNDGGGSGGGGGGGGGGSGGEETPCGTI